ncbi:MAG: DUF3450 domain-containing protein [Endozoicomonas sp.]
MNLHRLKAIPVILALSIGSLSGTAIAKTEQVDSILAVGNSKAQAAKKSQGKIDGIVSQTDSLLQDYKTVSKQIDGLNVYNARLQRQVDDQLRRLNDIDTSIEQVTVIQRQIMPLVVKMIDGLEQFVSLDVPFLKEERDERIAFLRANVDRSDLTTAEKFRQVLEAYKIENEYGRKIDTYDGTVDIDGAEREVKFFRVGRIALLYQTTDTEISGVWDQENRQWQKLGNSEYRSAIQKGLRIARKQASIDILKLPVSAPEAVQ